MTTQPERVQLDDLTEDALAALYDERDRAEARVRGLEGIVARVRRAVDTGPVGACCAHIIRAALTPPAGLCGCGRPDPGPCTPCPHRSTSLHCACVCDATVKATP
ncbi:hypothetical protein ACIBCC_19495 [Streptomyces griseus]|uniref:hypothetical protein n=1 Tax=Streptomyces griseus TaxID=1911 RepID=UPI00379F5A74